jgi:hypothetical protein
MSGARLVRVPTPYNAVELSEIDTEQSNDVMYMAHWDHGPTKLNRLSHTSWKFVTLTFGPTIPAPGGVAVAIHNPNQDQDNDGNAYFPLSSTYVVTGINDTTGQESRASVGVDGVNDLSLKRNYNKISWNASAGADRYRIYKRAETGGLGYIGTTTFLTFTDDNIEADQTQAPPNASNPFDVAGNWPSTVCFFEQSLYWGRTRNIPNGVWRSRSSEFENMDFASPRVASDSLAFKMVGAKANMVNQLVSTGDLLALTSDSVFKITGATDQGYISAAAPPVTRRQIGKGMSRLNPVIIEDVVFAQTAIGNEVRAINYTFQSDGYKGSDVTIFSPDLFKDFDLLWWAYAEFPRSVIWAGRSDGKLLCFTWQAEQEVWGWTLCETDGFLEYGCCINEASESRLYLIVQRVIGGKTVRYLERMASTDFTNEDSCFLDCALTVTLSKGDHIVSGLLHLEGRTVTAIAGGNVVSDLTVSGGKVDLGFSAPFDDYAVTVGLPFDTIVETLPLSFQSEGTNIAKRQQTRRAVLRVVNSRGILAGPDEDHLFPLKPRSTEPYGEPNALLTGDYEVDMDPVVANQTVIVVKSSDPLPLTISGVLLEPMVSE